MGEKRALPYVGLVHVYVKLNVWKVKGKDTFSSGLVFDLVPWSVFRKCLLSYFVLVMMQIASLHLLDLHLLLSGCKKTKQEMVCFPSWLGSTLLIYKEQYR